MTSPGPLSPPSESSSTASVDPSIPSPSQLPGHSTWSPAWAYFRYDSAIDKSICQVQLSGTEALCGKKISGKNPSNIKQHLKATHPKEFHELSKKEDELKRKKVESERLKRERSLKHYQQATLKETLSRHTVYSKDSDRYRVITKELAIFIGTSNVANRIVENLEFKDLLQALDPRHPVPSKQAFTQSWIKYLLS